MQIKNLLFEKIVYILLFINGIASQYHRQGAFQATKIVNNKAAEEHANSDDAFGLTLKHIYHFGEPEPSIEISGVDVVNSIFQQWDASEDKSYSPMHRIDLESLKKLKDYEEDPNFFQDNNNDVVLKAKKSITTLAKMAAHAYNPLPNRPWKDLGSDWKEKEEFGWKKRKVRGYIFSDKQEKKMIIAYKGTSFTFLPGGDDSTSPNDRESDNLMFSCCCGTTNANWTPVCPCAKDRNLCDDKCIHQHAQMNTTYFHGALAIYEEAKRRYPDAKFILTGHSLGGALASLVAMEKNINAVTFEAPGERLYARRLGLDLELKPETPFIYHFGNNADPIFMGTCNGKLSLCYLGGYGMDSKCHTNTKCTFDAIEDLGWLPSIFHHRIKEVVTEIFDDWADGYRNFTVSCVSKSNCTDCEDWKFK